MPILNNYHHFAGRHPETGTIHNYFAYCNITAPHTGEPYSEALLLGVSGGIVMGYFTFAYEGYDPHVALLTRNTFDPWDTMLARLGVVQEIKQTSKAAKGVANLIDALADGRPAIVWADRWSLPYNALAFDEGMWGTFPLIVYGYDDTADQVWIADRAAVPLTVTTDELMQARARIQKDKFRVMTLDIPDPEKLPAAVSAGIWDCIKLFIEKPPKGAKKNFGLAAYQHWIDVLTNPKGRDSWEKEFPAGVKLYAGLTSAFDRMGMVGVRGDGERTLYAEFLDEASVILKKPALREVAAQFRTSAAAWRALGCALLPDNIALFQETRMLTVRKNRLFLEQGGAALTEIGQINERLVALRKEVSQNFPLDAEGVAALCGNIAAQIQQIHDLEAVAVGSLREAMASREAE